MLPPSAPTVLFPKPKRTFAGGVVSVVLHLSILLLILFFRYRDILGWSEVTQPGDPGKLAKVLVDFVDVDNPPVRLPLGSDTVAAIEAKHAADAAILARWHQVSVSTDFAAEAASA